VRLDVGMAPSRLVQQALRRLQAHGGETIFCQLGRIASAATADIRGASRTEILPYERVQVFRWRLILPVFCKRGGTFVVGAKGSGIHRFLCLAVPDVSSTRRQTEKATVRASHVRITIAALT
jgi:hypothetical protein